MSYRNLSTGLLVVTVLCLPGCGKKKSEGGATVTERDPYHSFAEIAKTKQTKLESFLEGKNSKLTGFIPTVEVETNVLVREEYTHLGKIHFDYAVTPPSGEGNMQTLHKVIARYEYSTREQQWISRGCFLESGTKGSIPDEKLLVTYEEVKKVFEE